MVQRSTAFVASVLAVVAAEAASLGLPGSDAGFVLPVAAQQKQQPQPFRPGAGLIDQIRSGDVYRFGGARAPGRDWSFGWKNAVADPVLNVYEIREFREPKQSGDVPTLFRPVDLVVGVNDKTIPATSGHWRVPLLPGEMFMHPSSDLKIPTARFVVPTAGEYTITGFFQNFGCNGGINGIVSVVSENQGKSSVLVLAERATNAEEAPYKIIRDFKKGDLIDFSVDAVGNYSCDSTRLDAQIVPSQRVSPVPADGMIPIPGHGGQTGQNPTPPKSQPPQANGDGAMAQPPSQGQADAGQAQAGQRRSVSGKSKSRPAPSGVLDLQVKWWLWPGNQAQAKPEPKPQPKPQPPKSQPVDNVAPPVQPITPQPGPTPVPTPIPEPAPQPQPQPPQVKPQPQPNPQPPKSQSPQPGGVGSVDYSPLFARGVAKAALGDKRGAIADFSQAISINPKLAPAYYSRGLAKWDLNDKAGACADFKTARELGDVAAAATERKSCAVVQPPAATRP